ncbi:DUF2948 family protein [Hyphococcus sp. DH-69]|uniref:DUF2948 family protein n=1 Tax=Hyphococcus formosus TaxID=3143534 RepID=UPI00398A7344
MASLKDYKPLRLMAGDADDLQVISAYLQDAVGKIGDFSYLPEQRRFAFVMNRFLWESAGKRKVGSFARVRAGIHFDDVKSAQYSRLKTDTKDAVIELLSIRFSAKDDGAGVIDLDFAGGGGIRLDVESVNCFMSDISDPWRTRAKPAHDE